ncbi:MAG: sigma-70 family RNA polymerase sigma factor [Anaerolineales bacterium]|nr:sigma-70 family RNA polymerase sigma factor [Anaerolineales bacterium]
MQEAETIQRALQGDAQAWSELVAQHQQAVFRLAYLFLGDADDAEDVAQDAFIRAYQALSRFDPRRPLRPWLLRIAANLARNRLRSAGRYLAALQRLIAQQPAQASQPHLASQELDHSFLASRLWQAIRCLRPSDQEALYLRYFLEMSEAEMSSAWEVAPGTVKSRLHRAQVRLRSLIERQFPDLRQEAPL